MILVSIRALTLLFLQLWLCLSSVQFFLIYLPLTQGFTVMWHERVICVSLKINIRVSKCIKICLSDSELAGYWSPWAVFPPHIGHVVFCGIRFKMLHCATLHASVICTLAGVFFKLYESRMCTWSFKHLPWYVCLKLLFFSIPAYRSKLQLLFFCTVLLNIIISLHFL